MSNKRKEELREENKIAILKKLKVYTDADEFGLSPETLYTNIAKSKGSVKQLTKFFEVDEELILMILGNESDEEIVNGIEQEK